MNEMTGAEAMVRMLQLHGVKHIFGLCGCATYLPPEVAQPLQDARAPVSEWIA